MNSLIKLDSQRAQNARLYKKIGKSGYTICLAVVATSVILGLVLAFTKHPHIADLLFAVASLFALPAIWWKRYLSVLPIDGEDLTSRLSLDVLARLDPNTELNTSSLWSQLSDHWQSTFISNHLLLTKELVTSHLLSGGEDKVKLALDYAQKVADRYTSKKIELGYIIGGLLSISPEIEKLLVAGKSEKADIDAVVNWLARKLDEDHLRRRDSYGGIGRDWAFGFTPLLDRYGENISRAIEKQGAHFGALTESEGVLALEKALTNKAAAVSLVGPVGIGKSNSVYALAQRLLEGKSGPDLAYHQIVSINATDILSSARDPGDLERIMISLVNEASRAGNIILFLDEAQLYFNETPGAFDASQILLSIIEHRPAPIIMAIDPQNWERLRSKDANLASQISEVTLKELDQGQVMRVLEDSAIGIETQSKVLVSYDALKSAYKLSGRYNSDEAYPGKAIKLLRTSLSYANHEVITTGSIEKAVEQMKGVKVSTATAAEASELLNLEGEIHQRMVNQDHAVKTVASSLRRARAGVTNPNRPIGSFLFLGPTGVGKTELAKSLAATYFKDENNMIRLDMSEYQSSDSVGRLLSDGEADNASLIMSVREKPFSVLLLDEVEKSHPNILNLLLQLLDEGQLTDSSGKAASFKDCIIIATSNAGAQSIRDKVAKGQELSDFEPQLIEEIINSNVFKPELINRFDDIVLFRPLSPEELVQVVKFMLAEINKTLANQNITVELSDKAIAKIVSVGYDARLGARPMRRTLQKAVEDTVAQKILKGEAKAGDRLSLDVKDLSL